MEAKKTKAATATPAAPPPPPPSQPAAAGGTVSTAAYDSSAALEVARAVSNPHLISPPGSSLLWRAGRAGVIELSRDNGTSWSRQKSGGHVDLLTGSAPSERVCWISGRR